MSENVPQPRAARVLYGFQGSTESEMSISPGDLVYVSHVMIAAGLLVARLIRAPLAFSQLCSIHRSQRKRTVGFVVSSFAH